MKVFGHIVTYGMMTNLFDRYTNTIGWLNIPFLLYTVALYTVNYMPFLSEYVLLCCFILFVGFIVGYIVVGYFDYKYVFKSDIDFQYKGMHFFDENFDEMKQLLLEKKRRRVASRISEGVS